MIEPLASRLRTARTERGLSQEEVARALGVSRQSVSKWERGEALPSRANRQALAALYGLSPPRRKGGGEGGGPTGDSGAVCSRFLRLSTALWLAYFLQAEPSPFCIPWIWLGYLAAALALSCLLRRAVWAGRRPFWLAAGLIGCTAAPLLGTLALLVQASALSPFSASLWQNPPLYRSYLVQQPVHWWLLALFGLAMLAQLLGLALAAARCRWPSA